MIVMIAMLFVLMLKIVSVTGYNDHFISNFIIKKYLVCLRDVFLYIITIIIIIL